jgi:hypothetical protein
MTDENFDRAHDEADKRLADTVRAYLRDIVQITGDRDWQTDPSCALLGVARVALKLFLPMLEQGTDADDLLQSVVNDLADELGKSGSFTQSRFHPATSTLHWCTTTSMVISL